MAFVIDSTTTQIFDRAIEHEWLETNGLGGWASSSIIGTNTRRYHGLLVAAVNPPTERYVMLSKMDEALITHTKRYELGCNKYANAIHPDGYIFQQAFRKDFFPEFIYKANGIRLKKTIAAVHGENTTLIMYEVLSANTPFTLELTPLIAAREFHSLTQANGMLNTSAEFEQGIFSARPYHELPPLYISVPNGHFDAQPNWYFNFQYVKELERRQEAYEDLFSYGKFYIPMAEGDRIGIIVSTELPHGRDAYMMLTQESLRRQRLINQVGEQEDDSLAQLTLAADQFVVNRGDDLKSIIAGYHWFSDWGRDSMIALPGLCLTTGRYDDARKILEAFVDHIDQGMIPNRFPDFTNEPEYNTIDASLWFFVAAYKYLLATNDRKFIEEKILPALSSVIEWHDKGTRYNIQVDEDGLLSGGTDGVQLTWMDAKAGDWVFTPRSGKAVEINALWYNALEIIAYMHRTLGEKVAAKEFTYRAKKVKRAFVKTFWNKEQGYLFDYINGDKKDAAIRPNQIFAISLPFSLLSPAKSVDLLDMVESHLLTPFGLRSLSPDHLDYHAYYVGDQWLRDSAYHQGIVWSWLIGPYIDALVRVRGNVGREQARSFLDSFLKQMGIKGVGSISEIFDAEVPFTARGCIAQAWSIAELLRVSIDYKLFAPETYQRSVSKRRSAVYVSRVAF